MHTASVETLIRSDFGAFVGYAFRMQHGELLGNQLYLKAMIYVISGLIEGKINRVLVNLPAQHAKSYVGTICLAAYLLGINPRLRILLVAYNDSFAESLCRKIRDLMQSSWYQRAFATRIKEGHSRANDFETTAGGGVFAAGATGAITGRSADFIIYDDPHEIGDWNNERKLELVWANFNTVLSRLHDKVRGRVIVVAHRVSENDLSSHLLAEQGWTYLLLPLVAVRRRTYKLGHGEWVREKGDVLRPSAYPTREIERLRRTQLEPPFELFHQQGLGAQGSLKIRREHFQSFEEFQLPIGPVVLSIDPGFDSGLKASRSVIQAWKPHGKQHYLLGEFCQQCDADELRRAFWFFVKKWHPSIALIEDTANGPALYSAVRRKARFELRRVKPGEAKAVRFDRHRRKIRTGKIFLPALAAWRTEFIEELVAFPGDFDDRVDAMTQYLDFADTGERLTLPPARFNGLVLLASNYPGRRR